MGMGPADRVDFGSASPTPAKRTPYTPAPRTFTARAKLIPMARTFAALDAPKFKSEKLFQEAVVKLAKVCGFIVYHTFDSRRSEAGYPDLVLLHPWRKLQIVAELKIGSNKCSPAQVAWLEAYRAVGVQAYEWRPGDWVAIETTLRGVV